MSAAAMGLEPMARHCAALDPAAAEALIDQQAALAIREWRLADATFWQRVRYRSRLLRSARSVSADPSRKA
ncbi:MAG: hypothetical protein PGN08_13435 [Sphingomonas taxi]